ncbi:MAG: hypothetical protein J7J87_02850 [Candidatus Diapherotrites archaeon]|nr:hypothetical protein [Candidatus Diapherotrites archaeon]
MLTAILATVVFGLAIANIVLSLKGGETASSIIKENKPAEQKNGSLNSVVLFGNNNGASELAKIKRELALIRNDLQKNHSRVDFAFKKIHQIENALGKNNMGNLAYSNLADKVAKLEDFKREALIEIEAIKQHLQLPTKKKESFNKDIEEKIHRLVFRSRELLK